MFSLGIYCAFLEPSVYQVSEGSMILPKKMLCVWNSSSATMELLSFIISFMFSGFHEILFLLWLYNHKNCRTSYIKFHRTNVSYNITDNNENNNNIE